MRNERLRVSVDVRTPSPHCPGPWTQVRGSVSVHVSVPLGEELAASVNSEMLGGVGHEGRGKSLHCHSGIKFDFIFLHIFAR